MKIDQLANDSITIQARNEADYKKALEVANKMCENESLVIASVDEDEMWILVTTVWDNFQAKDLKDEYQIAKKAL